MFKTKNTDKKLRVIEFLLVYDIEVRSKKKEIQEDCRGMEGQVMLNVWLLITHITAVAPQFTR